ncbi:MAG: excisionase family DNA-binding protein [Gammaproteobacteria bacterium]
MSNVFKISDDLMAPPSDEDQAIAAISSSQLAAIIGKGDDATIRVVSQDEDITVPVSAIRMLVDILAHMAEGDAISIIPHHAEFTTQQAADFLNVSRPYFVDNILKKALLDFHNVGSHRRIFFRDLVQYKKTTLDESKKAMAELTAQAQELDMGYD